MSLKEKGRSVADITGNLINSRARLMFLIFVLLLTRGLMHSLYKSNVRDNVAILLFFAYSFFGGHVIDSVTSGSLFYYLLATMSSK